jgi:hypothetical protein
MPQPKGVARPENHKNTNVKYVHVANGVDAGELFPDSSFSPSNAFT